MKSYSCPGLSSGHFSRVCLLICTRVGEYLVCPYHICSQNTEFPQNWKKKSFSEQEKINLKNGFLHFEKNTALDIRFWECRIFSDFVFRHFLCKIIFSRGKGLDKELIFLAFFLHLPTTITRTKTENEDFASIFKI